MEQALPGPERVFPEPEFFVLWYYQQQKYRVCEFIFAFQLDLVMRQSVDFREKLWQYGKCSRIKLRKFAVRGEILKRHFRPALRTKELKIFIFSILRKSKK